MKGRLRNTLSPWGWLIVTLAAGGAFCLIASLFPRA